MFAIGLCIGTEAKYTTWAKPSIARHLYGDHVFERRQQTSIFEAYNSILDEIRDSGETYEGLILMHEDVELRAPVAAQLREAFADDDVAIVGAIGGKGVRSVRWYRSDERYGSVPDGFNKFNDHGTGTFDVDIVDGLFIAMSPWAMQNLRFDSSTFSGFHAYDADISMQARAAGKRVLVAPLDLHHHTKGGFGNPAVHRAADDAFRAKWGIPLDSKLHRLQKRLRKRVY